MIQISNVYKQVIIYNYLLNGSFESPFENWFNWLYDFITSDEKQVYVPQFPKTRQDN